MARKKAGGDETGTPGKDEEGPRVRRELDDDEIEQRRLRLADLSIEVLDLESERRESAQEINVSLKKKKGEIRMLAQAVRERAEWVPAQMELAEARASRRGAQRGTQDRGAPVEP